jgi:threonine 3-dehydrogenase
MKAIVKKEAREGLWLEDVPEPEIGINDVLIRILKTSICGTDVHIYHWNDWARRTLPVPMVIGHEFVGRIVAVGDNVRDFAAGDIVSGEGHLVCGRCRNCLAGRRHLCKDTQGIGVNRSGAFAEYLALPVTNVWHADPKIPLEVLACFDPLGNATHTALSFDVLGEDVLIAGAGPIGCMAAAIVRHAGARHVVVTDLNPYRLELARRMGATCTVDVRDGVPLAEVQRRLEMKEGFDVGLEMSGSPSALREMIDNMCHGGKIALLGIPSDDMRVDWNKIVFNMITLKGIYGREMYETWYKMTSMIQTGLDIRPVITHRFPYTEFQRAFDIMCSGQSGKVILHWAD